MRLLGYAYTARIKKKGNFGMKREGIEKGFSQKKNFGNKKYKILCDLSCASRRLGLGVVPLPYP